MGAHVLKETLQVHQRVRLIIAGRMAPFLMPRRRPETTGLDQIAAML